jgi:cell division protein FtsB
MTPCYQCLTPAPLSPRARCVTCEYRRSIANEQENEILYAEIDALKQEIQKLQKDLS